MESSVASASSLVSLPIRTRVFRWVYAHVMKPIFFRADPEDVHDAMTMVGRFFGSNFVTRWLLARLFSFHDARLEQTVCGIRFANPIGLSAGFDKNARLIDVIPSVGFGFIEIGSITGEPCEGNPRPRLWRLKKSQALVVYYGLKNDGAEAIAARLRGRTFALPVGVSVAKTNCAATVDTAAGVADYVKAYRLLADIGDYTTINISCPNTFGGEPFTDAGKLDQLLTEIDRVPTRKPVFLKLAPDITHEMVDAIIAVCKRHTVHGFVCTNLTKKRDNPLIVDEEVPEKGGISGPVVRGLADDMIGYVYRATQGKYVIIGAGGVTTAEDAYQKIRLGASLLQMITAMIFQGPQVIGEINRGLVALLERDGFATIADAVGVDSRGL